MVRHRGGKAKNAEQEQAAGLASKTEKVIKKSTAPKKEVKKAPNAAKNVNPNPQKPKQVASKHQVSCISDRLQL